MSTFQPVVDGEEVYGDGDWRPILGENPRKHDWKLYFAGKSSIDHQLRGIIFPSYDFSLQLEDKSFPMSIGRCWTDTADKRLPRHFQPNAFSLPILMYPYLGDAKEHWLSPRNRLNMIGNDALDPEEAADAFDDLNKWIRRNKAFSQEKKDFFLKSPSPTDDAPVPGRTVRYFHLGKNRDRENGWHKAITGYTSSAYSYLIDQMRWRHESDMGEPIDPDFPRYMLGDPTRTAGALVWHVEKMQIDPKDVYETNALCFTQRREFLDDKQESLAVTDQDLADRFLMVDPDNWNIPTYEQQVEHMLASYDPTVGIDMIKAACSGRCRFDIPDSRPESVTLSGGREKSPDERQRTSREEAPQDASSAAPTGSLAPSSSAPPMPDIGETAAAAEGPVEEKTYLGGKPGGKPQRLTVVQLQKIADDGEAGDYKVKLDDGSWAELPLSGLVTLPEVVPAEEAVPEEAVPEDTVPAEEEAVPDSDPPSDAIPAEVGDGITLAEMKLRLFPDGSFDTLPDDKKADAESLVNDAWEATDKGRNEDLPAELVDRMLAIIG